jgi:hypothetical protein
VLSWPYNAEAEEPRELSEAQRVRGQLAADLLHSWQRPPNLAKDGAANSTQLKTWVTQARELAAARKEAGSSTNISDRYSLIIRQGTDGA